MKFLKLRRAGLAATTSRLVLACSSAAFLAIAAGAQTPLFDVVVHRMVPEPILKSGVVARGDVDGDGDLDALVGNDNVQTRLYLNDGNGVFTEATAQLPQRSDWTRSIALGDVDGDGDLDAMIGNSGIYSGGSQNRLYLNDGSGGFTDVTALSMPVESYRTSAVALGDLDGDGDLDALIGNGSGSSSTREQDRVYLNDGAGGFTDAGRVGTRRDNTSSIALGDVDGDGDLDALIGNYGYRSATPPGYLSWPGNRLFLNDGNGAFSEASGQVPAESRSEPKTNFRQTKSVALGDIDGDGDLDAVIGNHREEIGFLTAQFGPSENQLWLNDGSGVFTDSIIRMFGDADQTNSIALGDVDADGDLDVLVGNAGQNRLFLNYNGLFGHVTATHMPTDANNTRSVALGDVDADGDLDALLGSVLYLNDSNGRFTDVSEPGAPPFVSGVFAVGDVDGDDDEDVIIGRHDAQACLYLNDSHSVFTEVTATHMPADSASTLSVALGDVDLDGDLDILIGVERPQQNRLYLNDGSGVFSDATATHMPPNSFSTDSIALGDVDGDGGLDAVLNNGSYLYLNNGGGVFTDATVSAGLLAGSSIALGDVDADGDLDALIGRETSYNQNLLLLNNGTGVFTDATTTHMPAISATTKAVALGDVDADGDLDALFGNSWPQDQLYLNDGAGVFTDTTATHMPDVEVNTSSIRLGDLDLDGDLDAFMGGALYLNDGTGVFTDATATHVPNVGARGPLADVDGDGDLDAVSSVIVTNLTRHLAWRGLPRVGKPLTLGIYGPAGGPSQLLLAAGAGRFDLPFGTLMLDPTTMVPAGAPPLDAQGHAAVTFIVPANPSFLGVSLYWQAVVASPLALTNLEVTTLTDL